MRRTKECAEQTRQALLDAAERVFEEKGVSRTSLQDVAQAAGLTRGAVYWHFKDKADLFNAMMDRTVFPMEQAGERLSTAPEADPVQQVREALLEVLRQIAGCERTRRVINVATRKAEFVAELDAARQRHLEVHLSWRAHIEGAVARAQAGGQLGAARSAREVAVGLSALLSGLIELWMLEPSLFPLVTAGEQSVDTYLAGLKA
ncbi:TetR family transcriptional regulator [Aquabacterium lacunae]|uniref:TetR family transcriptional regulator n=1 Tax=Aquabacterium lacunae TaxID=2528630 RepID=A0A4Q9H272_9BURK|nr:TetR family transcriptional regulator [Aquabacterium lacunae]TBO29446.1 TetR family transcriptional regulator [Aquabacterium lacunae]